MTMPGNIPYRRLIATLREIAAKLDAAKDEKARLALGRDALGAVMHYLHHDNEVLDGQLTRPLGELKTALHDAGRGANVRLLDHEPDRPGKPTGTAREAVQAMLAFALDLMIWSSMSKDQAAQSVAAAARKSGVTCDDGSAIVPRQIKTWRSDISREKAPAEACEAFKDMRRRVNRAALAALPPGKKREKCEDIARTLIKSLAMTAPRSAPRQSLRADGRLKPTGLDDEPG